jgi:hypothetical protein
MMADRKGKYLKIKSLYNAFYLQEIEIEFVRG